MEKMDFETLQRIKEGTLLVKLIGEAELAAKKCKYFAEHASNEKVKKFFSHESTLIERTKNILQDYYNSMLKG